MPKPHFCHTCTFYEKNIFNRTGESFGICHNVEVQMKVSVDGGTVLGEDGSIYTEEYFGCIYWRENSGTLIDINKLAEKFITGALPAPEMIVCKICGAENSNNNTNCIKCNCQL